MNNRDVERDLEWALDKVDQLCGVASDLRVGLIELMENTRKKRVCLECGRPASDHNENPHWCEFTKRRLVEGLK